MKIKKKIKDGNTIISTKDDNGNLIKLEIIDNETRESFISEYTYDSKNRVVQYCNNKDQSLQYDYDDKDRIIWKREQISRFTNGYHYMYKEDEEIISGEEIMFGNGSLLIVHCNSDEGRYFINIETDKIDNIKEVLEYCTKNEINISQPISCNATGRDMIFRFYIETYDKDQYNYIRNLFEIGEIE